MRHSHIERAEDSMAAAAGPPRTPRPRGPPAHGSQPWVQGGALLPLSLPVSPLRFGSRCSWMTAPAYSTLSARARRSGSCSAISRRPGECPAVRAARDEVLLTSNAAFPGLSWHGCRAAPLRPVRGPRVPEQQGRRGCRASRLTEARGPKPLSRAWVAFKKEVC